MNIGKGTIVSFKAYLDKSNPRGIHIGEKSYIAADSLVLSHDYINKRHVQTHIGRHVFIGAKAIILPGCDIADSVVVGAGAVVSEPVTESNVIVAGNPARIIKRNVRIGAFGQKKR
ncbi:acyltransferase [Saliniradius amylolyticus]|nr:DapH/DapD/GlmU-related protein [Saliniradius amylolyticus]